MTEFHVSLLAIGAVVVGGLVFHNKWQEWRAKKSVEQAFSPMEDDVLMDAGRPAPRQEPVLTPFEGPDHLHDTDASPDSSTASHGPLSSLPAVPDSPVGAEDADDAEATAPAPVESPRKRSPLDPALDMIVPLVLDAPLRGDKVVMAFQHLHLVGNKPVRVLGENQAGDWEPVSVGGVYRALQVGVAMATRSGALTELEFSELASRLDQLSDELGASPTLPEMAQVIAAARALHLRIHEFDAKLSINVRANSAPWMVATLKPALQRQGMELRPDGRLVMPDGDGGQLFSLSVTEDPTAGTSRQITLLLPVALVSPEREGFGAMTAFAKTIASRLSGTVVDDEGQPLSDATLAAIGQDVAEFYRDMKKAGIPPGSPLAHRLFA